VTDRQGYQGSREARRSFHQTSNICSSINTLPALLLLHALFYKRFFLRYRGYVAVGFPTPIPRQTNSTPGHFSRAQPIVGRNSTPGRAPAPWAELYHPWRESMPVGRSAHVEGLFGGAWWVGEAELYMGAANGKREP
jgi:hypothetical protein